MALVASCAASAVAAEWRYVDDTNPLGQRVRAAMVSSTNAVSLGWPYEGEQHATLGIRTDDDGPPSVAVSISRGQIICRNRDDAVVRFDDAPPEAVGCSLPESGVSTIAWLNNAPSVAARISRARRVVVALTLYQHGTAYFTFDVDPVGTDRIGQPYLYTQH